VTAKLIYSAISSLDGYVADADGSFDWAAPDEEVHRFVNGLERPVATYLYGRRMYDVMSYWESIDPLGDESPVAREFARLWRAADKIVFSRTLKTPASERTRIERTFDADIVRRLKASSATDISIGGPELAGQALRAGLVDECHLFLHPVLRGGGNQSLPDGVRLRLELLDERRFRSGVVYLRYRVEP
jgi:dihydrofolate reductase